MPQKKPPLRRFLPGRDFRGDGSIGQILGFEARTKLERPLFASALPAGFPSPAEDYIEARLDLNEYLIQHPAATFFIRVEGDSMLGAGIHPDDLLIVDRAVEPAPGMVIIAALDGNLTVKRLLLEGDRWLLAADNPAYEPIPIGEGDDFSVWGVVTYVIHRIERQQRPAHNPHARRV